MRQSQRHRRKRRSLQWGGISLLLSADVSDFTKKLFHINTDIMKKFGMEIPVFPSRRKYQVFCGADLAAPVKNKKR